MRTLAPASPAELSTAGTFWLDGTGLDPIYPDAAAWGTAIQKAVAACGYAAVVVVGFARFATHAIARATPLARAGRPIVFAAEPAERRVAAAVPLARLEIEPALRDTLARLGVSTLGQLTALPGGELLERFGAAAYRLHQLASAARWDPLVPVAPPELIDEVVLLDDEEREIEGLVFVAKGAVDRLLGRLAAKRCALTALHLELRLRHAVGHLETRVDRLRPAAPTLDARALLRLVHLRLEGAPPAAGVVALRVWADDAPATREQLALFAERPRRELRAADEALARLRAELGEDAVVTPVLRDGHLPEARFGWQRLGNLTAAAPSPRAAPPLVRRIFAKPRPLPVQTTSMRDDGWMLSDVAHGSVVRLCGPFLLSGGWWASEVCREYHFAETAHGHCLWAYYDRVRRLWFLQGEVE